MLNQYINYYTSVIILCWMALASLVILIYENDRINKRDKRALYLTCALIAVSALAEFCGVQLDGKEDITSAAIRIAKKSAG